MLFTTGGLNASAVAMLYALCIPVAADPYSAFNTRSFIAFFANAILVVNFALTVCIFSVGATELGLRNFDTIVLPALCRKVNVRSMVPENPLVTILSLACAISKFLR